MLYNDIAESWFVSFESSNGGPLRVQPIEALDNSHGGAWLTAVPQPTNQTFEEFLQTKVPELWGLKDTLLSYYRQSHRRQFNENYLFGLFNAAKIISFSLSVEEGIALIAHKLVWVPGSQANQLLQAGLTLMKVLCAGMSTQINWGKVDALFTQEEPCALTDMLRSPLAADPLQFCVQEELAWLDNRTLYGSTDAKAAKQAYDTARLGELLTLAQDGPLFTAALGAWERKARINIEGLRQAWMKKYPNS